MVLFGTSSLVQPGRRIALSNSHGVSEFGSRHNQCEVGCGPAIGIRSYRCRFAQPGPGGRYRRVKGVKKLGVRLGNSLSATDARALWQSPDAETLKGKCDRAII